MSRGLLLHVGCGADPLPEWAAGYDEVRLDIDERNKPDILASMLSMGDIGDFDAIACNHALEHLYPHEIDFALQEFKRVLKPGGFALIFVPDLEGIAPTDEVVYESSAGPITGHDMYYGFAKAIESNEYMSHKTGFVRDTLQKAMEKAQFSKVEVRRASFWNLLAVGVK